MNTLNGIKFHPLTKHGFYALKQLVAAPQPRRAFNPGVVDRLVRGNLAIIVNMPSPYKRNNGKNIEFLRITTDGELMLTSQKMENSK